MTIHFESTQEFEDDLKPLDVTTRSRVASHVNAVTQAYLSDKSAFSALAHKVSPIALKGNLEPSLYTVRAGNLRILLTVDDDPLFERVLVTLLRAVTKSQSEQTFSRAVQKLYGSLLQNPPPTSNSEPQQRQVSKRVKRAHKAPEVVKVG